MAKLNLNSVLEAFLFAEGIPSSVWCAVPEQATATAQPEARTKKMTPKERIPIVGVRQCMTPAREGNHGE